MRTIAIRCAIDLVRRRRPEVPLSDTERSPRDEGAGHEDADLLRAALAELSALDRELMIARELEGVSDRELALRFEITLSSVRVRMHRARKKIRARFSGGHPMSAPECREPRDEAAHLLTCSDCLARVRVAAAWQALSRADREAASYEPNPPFVQRTVAAFRHDRERRRRRRLALAAAAALLFFFCMGTGHETAASATASPEESYASLFSSGAPLISD